MIRKIIFCPAIILLVACNSEKSSEPGNATEKTPTYEEVYSTLQHDQNGFPELDQSLKGDEASSCNLNRVFIIEGYEDAGTDEEHPEFLYVELEMMGNVGIDLDDIEGKIETASNKTCDTWVYDSWFLDAEGNPAKSSEENNNKDYTHIGLIMPSCFNPATLELWYWGDPLCPGKTAVEKEKGTVPDQSVISLTY